MDELSTAAGVVALAAAVGAAAALTFCALVAKRIGRLRADQSTVMGGEGRDLVAHAAGLERELGGLREHVQAQIDRLDHRDAGLELGLRGAVSHFAVVRYDALGEMSGRQSSSVALLDSHRDGVVLSSILHREQARLYAKQIVAGRSEIELSPEEQDAVERALRARGEEES